MSEIVDYLGSELEHERNERKRERKEWEAEHAANVQMRARLQYYENPNAPPSTNSLEWKKQKRDKKKAAAKAKKEGKAPPRKKPGGRRGHPGKSRKHRPVRTETHRFDKKPECSRCGCGMSVTERIRDIQHLVPARLEEVRHVIESSRCHRCGATGEAQHDLPRKGSYDKNIVGLIAEFRAARVPLDIIPGVLHTAAGGLEVSKAAVTNVLYRIGEALEPEKGRILENIWASMRSNVDETGANMDGETAWATVIRSGKLVWMEFSKSRGAMVMDKFMDKFEGVVTSDMWSVYDRFDKDGKHQVCWAHELRHAKHAAERHGKDRVPPRLLYEDLCRIFADAKESSSRAEPSQKLRRAYEHSLRCLIQRYREGEDEEMRKLLNRLDKAHPRLFAFLEFAGVEPTNNAAEQALRYYVVLRKISGQIKGGIRAARSLSAFITCVQTWRNQGKSVSKEVGRLI